MRIDGLTKVRSRNWLAVWLFAWWLDPSSVRPSRLLTCSFHHTEVGELLHARSIDYEPAYAINPDLLPLRIPEHVQRELDQEADGYEICKCCRCKPQFGCTQCDRVCERTQEEIDATAEQKVQAEANYSNGLTPIKAWNFTGIKQHPPNTDPLGVTTIGSGGGAEAGVDGDDAWEGEGDYEGDYE